MISRREMESARSYETRVLLVDALLSRSILALNDQPTTPNLPRNLNPPRADGIDPRGETSGENTGNESNGDQNNHSCAEREWIARTDCVKQGARHAVKHKRR